MQPTLPPAPAAPLEWRTVATIVRRELRDSVRDWRIVVPVFLLTAIFPFLMTLTAQGIFDFLRRYDATVIGERFIPFGLMVVGFFPITFSLVIALETFVGEKERSSLEALLATPASDLELYLGKLLAALLLPLAASYVGIAIYLATIAASELTQLSPLILFQVLLLTTLEGLVMVSGAVIVSSHTTSVRAANLLASFIIIPAALLVQAIALLMFWGSYSTLWLVAAGLLVVDVILLRAGMRTFNREEILSREMDVLNLRRLAQQGRRLWLAPPDQARRALRTLDPLPPWSLRRFYRAQLPALLREGTRPLAVSALVMALAFLAGWLLAGRFPLPAELFDLQTMAATLSRARLAEAAPGWSVLPTFNAPSIFGHNLRATLLTIVLSLFSFGAMALLLVGLPMSVVGFLAAQVAMAGQGAGRFLLAFILPHGLLELPATLLATAFALRIGAMMMAPPERLTVGEALMRGLADFAKLFLLVVVPLLLLAALLEVYVTPAVIRALYGG